MILISKYCINDFYGLDSCCPHLVCLRGAREDKCTNIPTGGGTTVCYLGSIPELSSIIDGIAFVGKTHVILSSRSFSIHGGMVRRIKKLILG